MGIKTIISHINTVRELAFQLEMRVNTLVYYSINDQSRFYSQFDINKKTGGTRTISAPNKSLKEIQRRIYKLLVQLYAPSEAAFGGVRKRHIRSNALRHKDSLWILRIDLEDFYGTITRNRVFGLLRKLGFETLPAAILSNLTTLNGVLPQGAPTSPVLANMVCRKLDTEMTKYAQRYGLRYTRYFDDLVFSAPVRSRTTFPPESRQVRPEGIPRLDPYGFRRIVEQQGFKLNENKTRFKRRRIAQYVTGVKINENPNVSRPYIRNVRAILHDWEVNGYKKAQERFEQVTGSTSPLKQVIRGRIEHIGFVRSSENPKEDEIYLKLRLRLAGLKTTT